MGAVESAVKKVNVNDPSGLDHFLSAFPAQLLFRSKIVKGVSGNAVGLPEYVGFAPCNAALYSRSWQIKKLIYDSTGFNTDVLFADGTAEFKNVFDSGASEYANYTYSAT